MNFNIKDIFNYIYNMEIFNLFDPKYINVVDKDTSLFLNRQKIFNVSNCDDVNDIIYKETEPIIKNSLSTKILQNFYSSVNLPMKIYINNNIYSLAKFSNKINVIKQSSGELGEKLPIEMYTNGIFILINLTMTNYEVIEIGGKETNLKPGQVIFQVVKKNDSLDMTVFVSENDTCFMWFIIEYIR